MYSLSRKDHLLELIGRTFDRRILQTNSVSGILKWFLGFPRQKMQNKPYKLKFPIEHRNNRALVQFLFHDPAKNGTPKIASPTLIHIKNAHDLESAPLNGCHELKIDNFPELESEFERIIDSCVGTLKYLDLSGCQLSRGRLNRLIYRELDPPCKELEYVDLTDCQGFTPHFLQRLQENNPQLKTVKAVKNQPEEISESDSLAIITSLPSKIENYNLTNRFVVLNSNLLMKLSTLTSLRKLALSVRVDEEFNSVLKSPFLISNLEELEIIGDTIKDSHLISLLEFFPHLKVVALNCPSIQLGDEVLTALKEVDSLDQIKLPKDFAQAKQTELQELANAGKHIQHFE